MHALKVIRTPEQCHKEYSIVTWVNTFGIIVSQIVLLLRTLAIWERKPLMAWFLVALFLCTVTPSLIIVHFYLKTLRFVPVNPLIKYGCSLESSSGLLLVNYVLVLFSETTIVILTFIRGIKHLRHSNSHWVRELYASGFAFYVFLLVVTVANLIYPFVASPSLKSLFSDPQRALHALLCNHVIFIICSRQRPSHDNDLCDFTTTTSRNHNANNDDHHQDASGNAFVLSTVLDTFVTDDEYMSRDDERYGMQEVDRRRREDEETENEKARTTTLSGTWEEERREREV
ncbi:hypothetical protein BJ165DRAFT_384197 [Panaeolus papilionaceus]|nr:hypothetical protein BJ165DRAFT_384197 [Panaeolus papilionaceus]